jgi:hypothetical protein
MDRRLIFLLFFALPQVTCAQYLVPAREVNIHNKKYYEEVLALLYQDFSEKPLARFTVIPSFTSEYSFSLETRKGKPFISTRFLSGNYHMTKDKASIKVTAKRRYISKELYFKLAELFQAMGQNIRAPSERVFGADGATYRFEMTDKEGNVLRGETWSPSLSSVPGRLVCICNDLMRSKRAKPEAGILEEVESLISDLIKEDCYIVEI